jgi:hypothetical protein
MNIQVETYSGYKADERPKAFSLGRQRLEVTEVTDQWYDPNSIYFRVSASDGNMYILRHNQDPSADSWTLEAYRRQSS